MMRRWRTGPIGAMVALFVACGGSASGDASAEGVPNTDGRLEPEMVGPPWPDANAIERILAPVREQVEAGAFPGATIALGQGSRVAHLEAIGHIGWTRNAAPTDPVATVYDLASVTKVVATGTAILRLVDEGKLALDDPAGRFLPEFREGPKARVTIRHLLTHTSGVPQGATLQGEGRAARLARARSFSIYPPAGARVEYSDIGYILLGEIIEAAAGERLPAYLERTVFRPLAMTSTGFAPGLDCELCAPTGRLRDQSLYRGRPFDPLAQRLDGVSGHAGLFSTAHDLARFVAMVAGGGELDGVRVLSPESAAEFVAPQPVGRGYRLAWEEVCREHPTEAGVPCPSPVAVGHTGWTGTSIHLDLDTGVWVVLLTNRTYEPRAPNRLGEVRREVFGRAVDEFEVWRAPQAIR